MGEWAENELTKLDVTSSHRTPEKPETIVEQTSRERAHDDKRKATTGTFYTPWSCNILFATDDSQKKRRNKNDEKKVDERQTKRNIKKRIRE